MTRHNIILFDFTLFPQLLEDRDRPHSSDGDTMIRRQNFRTSLFSLRSTRSCEAGKAFLHHQLPCKELHSFERGALEQRVQSHNSCKGLHYGGEQQGRLPVTWSVMLHLHTFPFCFKSSETQANRYSFVILSRSSVLQLDLPEGCNPG